MKINYEFEKYDPHISKFVIMSATLADAVDDFCKAKNYSAKRRYLLIDYLCEYRAFIRNKEIKSAIRNLSWDRPLSSYEQGILSGYSEDVSYYELVLTRFEKAHPKIVRDAIETELLREYMELGRLEGKKTGAEEVDHLETLHELYH